MRLTQTPFKNPQTTPCCRRLATRFTPSAAHRVTTRCQRPRSPLELQEPLVLNLRIFANQFDNFTAISYTFFLLTLPPQPPKKQLHVVRRHTHFQPAGGYLRIYRVNSRALLRPGDFFFLPCFLENLLEILKKRKKTKVRKKIIIATQPLYPGALSMSVSVKAGLSKKKSQRCQSASR